jgi:uncharacterized protein YjbJ (UPF0337 family)
MSRHFMRAAVAVAAVIGLVGCKNSEYAKGQGSEAKGQMEKAAGDVTGSDSLKAAGKADETKGKVQKGVGNVEHAVNP